jgi:alpha-ketoglutarate-dependent taurine dioxygenase
MRSSVVLYLSSLTVRVHVDPGLRADPEKKALVSAATEVIHLTKHIGTELVGLQLTKRTDQQKDELARLVAERSVVFLRDQEIEPREQLEFGKYFGEIEVHPQGPQVLGLPGVTVIWPDYNNEKYRKIAHFRNPGGASGWHTDLVHEKYPAGFTHLHNVFP